jgi:hypothetical protein
MSAQDEFAPQRDVDPDETRRLLKEGRSRPSYGFDAPDSFRLTIRKDFFARPKLPSRIAPAPPGRAPATDDALAMASEILEELAAAEESIVVAPAVESALWSTHDEDTANIGRAFEVLLKSLPNGVQSLTSRLTRSPKVSRAAEATLRAEKDVCALGRDADALIAYGLTPVTILYGVRGLEMLFDRAIESGLTPRDRHFRLSPGGMYSDERRSLVVRRELTNEMAIVTRTDESVAEALYDWTLEAAIHQPRLFDGFHSGRDGDDVRLIWTTDTNDSLFERWAPRARPVGQR